MNLFARTRASGDESFLSPVHRIVNTIVMYALWNGAHEVRIEPRAGHEKGTGALGVFYFVNSEWREQMKIPLSSHEEILKEIRKLILLSKEKRGCENQVEIQWQDELLKFAFTVFFKVQFYATDCGEAALLTFSLDREPEQSFEQTIEKLQDSTE